MENMQTYPLKYTGDVIQEKLDKIDGDKSLTEICELVDTAGEDAGSAQGRADEAYALADEAKQKADTTASSVANIEERLNNLSILSAQAFIASKEAPEDTNLLWIDLNDDGNDDGGLKYHNGTGWVSVPVRFS